MRVTEQRRKLKKKLLVWVATSIRSHFDVFFHSESLTVNGEVFESECIQVWVQLMIT